MFASKSATATFRAFSAAGRTNPPLRPSTAAVTSAALPLRRPLFTSGTATPLARPNATTNTSTLGIMAHQRFMSTTPSPRPSSSSGGGAPNSHAHAHAHPAWIRAFAKFANGKQPGEQGFWVEVAIIFTVFAVTGSSSLMVVRKAINQALGVEGSLKDGPNSWRLAYLTFGLPMYSAILLTLGTLSGRGAYFRMITHRMYGRILPKAWADKLKV